MKGCIKKFNPILCEKGAQLIEFAFVFPISLVILVGFVDISTIEMRKTELNKKTQDAAEKAAYLPNIDYDLNQSEGVEDHNYKRYLLSRKQVDSVKDTSSLYGLIDFSSDSEFSKVKQFLSTDFSNSGTPNTTGYTIAVVRPGECVQVLENDAKTVTTHVDCSSSSCTDENCFKHPVVPPKASGQAYGGNYKTLFDNNDVMTVMQMEVKTLMPCLGVLYPCMGRTVTLTSIGRAKRLPIPATPFATQLEEEFGITNPDYTPDPPVTAPSAPSDEENPTPICNGASANTIRHNCAMQALRLTQPWAIDTSTCDRCTIL